MTTRRLAYLSACIAGLAVAATIIALSLGVTFATGGPHRLDLRGTEVFSAPGRLAPRFTLRDQQGKRFRLSQTRGKVVAITFMDANCRKNCPIEGAELASMERDLGSARGRLDLVVVAITPRNTPGEAQRFVHRAHIHGRWFWLTGSYDQLSKVWRSYGILVRPIKGDIEHTTVVYLVDPRGHIRVADAIPLLPGQLAESIRALAAGPV